VSDRFHDPGIPLCSTFQRLTGVEHPPHQHPTAILSQFDVNFRVAAITEGDQVGGIVVGRFPVSVMDMESFA
jgi:hypothetical protein